jgi:hypothetical protein
VRSVSTVPLLSAICNIVINNTLQRLPQGVNEK